MKKNRVGHQLEQQNRAQPGELTPNKTTYESRLIPHQWGKGDFRNSHGINAKEAEYIRRSVKVAEKKVAPMTDVLRSNRLRRYRHVKRSDERLIARRVLKNAS